MIEIHRQVVNNKAPEKRGMGVNHGSDIEAGVARTGLQGSAGQRSATRALVYHAKHVPEPEPR